MSRRIVLAGGSGFIGRYLAAAFRADGDQVSVIGRTGPDAAWGDTAAITAVLDGADLLVNLAGKSVNCRYTAGNRAEILRSRVETTRELAAAVRACVRPPRLWLNSSTATIYRHAEDRAMTESTGEIGTGYSVSIATAWEDEFFGGELPGTRRVALRMAIVLGDGSALVPLRRLAWAGLGGPQLDGPWPITRARRAAGTGHAAAARCGRQRFSWIHLDDVLGAIRFIDATPSLTGPVNLSAPEVSDNATLMRQLRWLQGRAVGLPGATSARRTRHLAAPHRIGTGAQEPLGTAGTAARGGLPLQPARAAAGPALDRAETHEPAAGRVARGARKQLSFTVTLVTN
jgi:NAD dependent epimerase/dehydratase family enzyme